MDSTENEFQSLQARIIELERQLAEAQAAIQTLTARKKDSRRTNSDHSYEPVFHELKQRWEQEKANFLANEERLQSALIVVPHPLMIRRDDGQVMMVNAAWQEITGYSLEEIPTIDEWTRKAYGESAPERRSEILNEGFSQNGIKKWGEFEITTRSGAQRIWDFSTAPLGVDEKGRRLMMAMAVDITERKISEEKLRAARDEANWLARFPGENPNPVVRVSEKGIVLYCNSPAASLRGWRCATQAMIPRPLLDLVELAGEQDQIVEQDVSLGDKFYSVSVIPLLEQGYLNLYGRDITERKQTEKALAESERRQREITRLLEVDQARLAAILQHLPVGIWIADQTGRLIGSNEQADRIWAGESPLLNSIAEYPKYESRHPESGELLQPEEYPLAVALRTGEPVKPMELNIRRFDGSEGTILAWAAPVKDRQGGLTGAVGVNVDITERKQAEAHINDLLSLNEKILNHSSVGILTYQVSGQCVFANEKVASIVGTSVAELLSQNFHKIASWKKSGLYDLVQQAISTQAPATADIHHVSTFGKDLWLTVHCITFQSKGQDHVLLSISDVTVRKQMEEALRASNERVNDILRSLRGGLLALDRNWSIIYINGEATRVAGLPMERLIGQDLWKLWPELLGTPLESFYRQAMQEGIAGQLRIRGSQSGRWYDVNVSPSSEGITVYYEDKTEQILVEERFNKAFHASPNVLVISHQKDGRIEIINDTFVNFFGYSREEVIGKTSVELGMFVNPRDRQEAVQRLQKEGSVRDFELEIRLKSGEVRNAVLAVERVEIGGEHMMLTTIQDITLRKQAEQALRESEERYRGLFEKMQEGLVAAEMVMDEHGKPVDYRYLDINPATERQFGIPREGFVGRTYTEVLPEGDPEWIDIFARVAQTGEPISLERYGRASKRWFECHLYSPRPGQVVNITTDITDRKRAEEHIAYQAKLLANVNDAIVGSDAEFRLTAWNAVAESIYGWKAEEVLGRNGLEVVQTQWPQEDANEMRRMIAESGRWRGEATQLRKDGTRIPVEVSSMVLRDERGQITGYVSVNRDITERKKAEQSLQESETKYRNLFENMVEEVHFWQLVRDEAGQIKTWRLVDTNPPTLKSWGRQTVEEIKGMTTDEIFGPGATEHYLPIVQKIMTDGIPYSYEDYFPHLDKYFRFTSVPLEDHFITTGADITGIKKAQEELRQSEQRLQRAQEIAHLGSWELDLVNNRLIWSDEVYRIFGLQPQEFAATYEAFLEAVHPDDRAAVDAAYSGSIHEGRDMYEIEHRVVRRSSGEVRIVHEKCEHFRDQSGQIIRSTGMVHDITERKQAEEALQQSERRFRSLADSMPQLVWTALPDGTVDYYNQRYHEYHEIKQIKRTGWEWSPVLHPDDLQPTIDAWQRSLASGDIYQMEHRVRMTDGSYRWHLSRGVPVRDESGQIIRWFGTATDIHDMKLAEEQLKDYAKRLEHSNRELEQFAFIASHDLQEPLRKIEMFGDMLLERATGLKSQERNYIDRMRNASARMRDMVEGLLHLSRVTTQGKPFRSVDLAEVTSEVLHDLESQIRRVNGRVDVEPLPAIEGDALQLRQLMQNLIGNALKYGQPGKPPEVKIYAKQLPGQVQIFVQDQGIGFAEEDAERVFQPFQRLVGRSQYEGSGIGLAICRRIVERHGGEITALSQPGHGATFIVALPSQRSEST